MQDQRATDSYNRNPTSYFSSTSGTFHNFVAQTPLCINTTIALHTTVDICWLISMVDIWHFCHGTIPNSSRSAVGEAVSMVFTKTLAVNSKASWSFMPDEFSAASIVGSSGSMMEAGGCNFCPDSCISVHQNAIQPISFKNCLLAELRNTCRYMPFSSHILQQKCKFVKKLPNFFRMLFGWLLY